MEGRKISFVVLAMAGLLTACGSRVWGDDSEISTALAFGEAEECTPLTDNSHPIHICACAMYPTSRQHFLKFPDEQRLPYFADYLLREKSVCQLYHSPMHYRYY